MVCSWYEPKSVVTNCSFSWCTYSSRPHSEKWKNSCWQAMASAKHEVCKSGDCRLHLEVTLLASLHFATDTNVWDHKCRAMKLSFDWQPTGIVIFEMGSISVSSFDPFTLIGIQLPRQRKSMLNKIEYIMDSSIRFIYPYLILKGVFRYTLIICLNFTIFRLFRELSTITRGWVWNISLW